MDNCPGHVAITYEPKNIKLLYFEPNLTAFVQPLDARIIRCFKAHYRKAFCQCAIELDDAGERDIYKIDLLESLTLAKEAWDAVSEQTISNCWFHTQIVKRR
jgi:hypothetical protein